MTKLSKIIFIIAVSSCLFGCGNSPKVSSSLSSSISSSSSSSSILSSSSSKQDFQGISFADQSFDYDGQPHSIFVSGAPSFASVSYEGNGKTEIGVYPVTATITADGYNDLTLNATMTIVDPLKEFSGLVFNSLSVDYDGEPHSIYVTNLPSDAINLNVSYSGNNKTGVGIYTVTANVTADNYHSKSLTAKLTIKALSFKGVSFKDKKIPYDGNSHSIYIDVEGSLPEGSNVSYSGNNKSSVGTYTVTATITCTGFQKLTLSAKMTIAKMMPVIESLKDRTLFYDGDAQLIRFEYPKNLPSYSEATFKVDGKSVESEDDLRVTSIGKHTVSVTLSNEKYSYESTTTTATINVIANNVGGVDSSKEAFKITQNLKYQELRKEILKGNFTVKYQYFNDFDYDKDGVYEVSTLDHTEMIYVADNEAFRFTSLADKSQSSAFVTETHWQHTKIVGDEVLENRYDEGLLNDYECIKYPSSAYSENVIGQLGTSVLAYLNEAEDGGFENGQEGGYTTTYGTFKIDPSSNSFNMDSNAYYFHTEWNHAEHGSYTIYNIGNTKIDMVKQFSVEETDYSLFEESKYIKDGFEYRFYDDYVSLEPNFDAKDIAYVEKGTYVLPAVINGLPVTIFTNSYYAKYYNQDCSGYTFKAYFNEQGYYQGDYADLGKISNFGYLDVFLDDGGTVLYYGEW